jgi:hypothetical protein
MMRRALLATAAAAAAIALPPARAGAQVNVEALRANLDEHPRYLAIQASFEGHVGNTNGAVGSAGAFAGAVFGRNTLFAKLQGDYAEFSGAATIAKAFAHVRYDYRFLPFLFGEAFAQVEENQFQRLALRQVNGFGLRFALVRRERVQLSYGTAWMTDYEKLSDDQGRLQTFVGPHWWAQRWSNYVGASFKLGDRARLADVFYVQPRVNGFSDVRVLNDATFVMDIDKRFSAKVDAQVHYNSIPPSRVVPLDVDTITSIVLTL